MCCACLLPRDGAFFQCKESYSARVCLVPTRSLCPATYQGHNTSRYAALCSVMQRMRCHVMLADPVACCVCPGCTRVSQLYVLGTPLYRFAQHCKCFGHADDNLYVSVSSLQPTRRQFCARTTNISAVLEELCDTHAHWPCMSILVYYCCRFQTITHTHTHTHTLMYELTHTYTYYSWMIETRQVCT